MTNRPSTEPPVVEYSGKGPGNTGCGMLFLQAIGGFFLPFIGAIAAHSFIPVSSGTTTAVSISLGIQSAALLLVIALMFRGRPGYLIGFLIAGSILGLLTAACGIRTLG